jgi:hypothetical protein
MRFRTRQTPALASSRPHAETPRVQDLGKLLFIIGLVLVVIGAVLWKTGGIGGLGRLPGDVVIEKGNSSFYFPIVTCILISLILTLLAWLFRR